MAWRAARSLTVLLREANARAPGRSTVADGLIADAAHAARASRHNPNAAGVVTARDLTHDPAGGFDAHRIARDELTVEPLHPDLAYVISDGELWSRTTGRWRPYGGHPHDTHIHVAVGRGPDRAPTPPYDTLAPWGIADPSPIDFEEPTMRMGDTGNAVKRIQEALDAWGRSRGRDLLPRYGADGDYGAETGAAVAAYQTAAGLPVTGTVDGLTAALVLRYLPLPS